MKVAVYGDIHDNFHNLRKAFKSMKSLEIEQALCLGDVINPGVVKEIIDQGIRTHMVWGNNDGDLVQITKLALASNEVLTVADKTYDTFELDEMRVAMLHHPDIAPSLARSGDFDAVFYGHNHLKHFELIGNCILANPGELSAHVTDTATFIIWDTDLNEVEFVEIEDPYNPNK